jgi:hypothetical protein
LTAKEQGLRTTVRAVLIATLATRLTRVAWVYLHHLNTLFLCFVREERVELGKAPTMQTSLGIVFLALANLRGVTNVGEVFHNDRTARGGVLDNALREDMIVFSSLPKQFARKFLQVPFGRACSFRLQLSTDAKNTPFLLFPSPLT